MKFRIKGFISICWWSLKMSSAIQMPTQEPWPRCRCLPGGEAGILCAGLGTAGHRWWEGDTGNPHQCVRTFAEWAGRKRGSNTELGSRTVFEYKRCLPHRVWGWLSQGALIMNSSPFLRLQGWGPVLLSAPCALYKYSQLFSKSALSGDSE